MTESHDRIRRSILTAGGSVAVGALIGMPRAASAQPSVERVQLTIAVGPEWGTGGHAVVALNKGFFREEGLTQITLKSFPAGLMQVEALAAGGVDLANPAQGPVISLRSNGVPVVVLSSLAAYQDSLAIAIRRTANMKDALQLEGLKIGVLKGTSAEQMLQTFAARYKVDLSKVQLVNLAPPEQLASLATGAIDGVCVWQPWVHQAGQKLAVDVVHTGARSGLESNRGERVRIDNTRSVLTATERFVRSNPRTTDAVLRAYAKAQAWATDARNYDELVELFSKHHNQDAALNRVLLKEYGSSLALDQAYDADMTAVQEFLTASGRLKNKVQVSSYTYGAPLRKVSESLVSVEAAWKP